MATVHYDWDAPTNGTGTSASPKNTWTTPSNGDVIRFRRGTSLHRTAQLSMSTASGLTLEAWFYEDGSDEPLLPKPKFTASVSTSTFMPFSGTGVHTLRNLHFSEIRNSSNPNNNSPAAVSFGTAGTINVDPGVSGEVYFCDFDGIGGNAIQYNGIGSPSFASLAAERGVVKWCTFDDIGSDAVFAKIKTYFEVSHCHMTRLSQRDTNGDGVGFLDANPAFAWVHHNYIDHRDVDSKQCVMIDGVDGSGYALIEHNELYGYGDADNQASVHIMVNVESCRANVRWNKLYNCAGYGIVMNVDGSNAHHNVIQVLNFRDSAHTVSVLFSNGQLNNNTIEVFGGKVGSVITTGTGRSGLSFKNNLCIGADTFLTVGSGTSASVGWNALWQTSTDYAGPAPTVDGDDITSDPMVTSDYVPLPGSPLLTSGADLGYIRDIRGYQSRKHIGAYGAARLRSVTA